MSDTTQQKKAWSGETVEVLGERYEAGKPRCIDRWTAKLRSRKEMLAYLDTAERYWTAKEGFGSEKRKTPA
jgi:hypothetical protein